MCEFFKNAYTGIIASLEPMAQLATIFAAVGLWYAYRQYKHSVELAKSNNRRASIELAAKECTHFGLNLQQKINELLKQISQSGCDYLNHCKQAKSEKGLQVDTTLVTPLDREKVQAHIEKIVEALNSLEGFAIPFAEGVADDRVGFVECGRGFVQVVERLAPFYYFWPLKDYYISSQILYMRWSKRIEQEEKSRKFEQTGKEFIVAGIQMFKGSLKSRFWQALADWCLKQIQK
jgi:hypothetical protein